LNLYIIDGSGPFFYRYKNPVINWSKLPHHHFEKRSGVKERLYNKVIKRFLKYIKRVKTLGFNAISIDDLSHIVNNKIYNMILQRNIANRALKFKILFKIIKNYDLQIFVNTDFMFYNKEIDAHIKNSFKKALEFFSSQIIELFQKFPEISGVIFRFGESDGVDHVGSFRSRIIINTPSRLKTAIKHLLPIFEKYNKKLIIRTWSIGSKRCAHLMWNKQVFIKVFGNIQSESLIISMKYGEGDFFKYLKFNELFSQTDHKKIVELQTRREYEGFGAYPYFVGYDYYNYYLESIKNKSIIGISVWCQTGGWSKSKFISIINKSGFWGTLNTFVTIKIFKEQMSVDDSLRLFYSQAISKGTYKLFKKFIDISDNLVNNVLYDPGFTKNDLYINKLRLPPLLYVFWDNVIVNKGLVGIFNSFISNKIESTKISSNSLDKIKELKKIGNKLHIPYNYRLHYDTMLLFYLIRQLMYNPNDIELLNRIEKLIEQYHDNYPEHYKFSISENFNSPAGLLIFLIKLVIRKKKRFRILDNLIFNPITSFLIITIIKLNKKSFPEFAGKIAMPVENFF